jgi:serine/threonine-protein kinase
VDARRSVAVLPFVNVGRDPAEEYFSDGMTEELINALGQVQGVRVAARTSSFAFKGKSLPIREIARQLNVAAVLEGSVRREADSLRIVVRLVRADSGYTLWSERYDRELSSVFAVQEEIAQAIVRALRPELGAGARGALVVAPTRDLAAWELYLRGRELQKDRSRTNLLQSVKNFEAAIARDSAFAQAYAALADSHILSSYWAGRDPAEVFARARWAADRALALDSTLAEAHASQGYLKSFLWDWAGADADFRRAIRLAPGNADVHFQYGYNLGRMTGRFGEASREFQLARNLDPLSRSAITEIAWLYALQRRYDEALPWFRKVQEMDPGYGPGRVQFARTLRLQGRYAQAITEVELGAGLTSAPSPIPTSLGFVGHILAAAGQRARAYEIIEELKSRTRDEFVPPFAVAYIYAGLGDREQAFAWLERAVSVRDPVLTMNHLDPALDPLRADPRFARLYRMMHLPPSGRLPGPAGS